MSAAVMIRGFSSSGCLSPLLPSPLQSPHPQVCSLSALGPSEVAQGHARGSSPGQGPRAQLWFSWAGPCRMGLCQRRCFECQVLPFCGYVSWWELRLQRKMGSLRDREREPGQEKVLR